MSHPAYSSSAMLPPYTQNVQFQLRPRDYIDLKRFPKCSVISVSILQIISGVVSIGFGIGAILIYHYFDFGSAIWCSPLYIIAGSFGVVSAIKRNKCLVISFMILSILSSCFSVIPLITYSISLADVATCYDYYYYYYCGQEAASIAVYSIILLFSLLEIVVAIISAVYCCRALSCSCCYSEYQESSLNVQTGMYYRANQQQLQPIQLNQMASTMIAPPQASHYQPPPQGMLVQNPANIPVQQHTIIAGYEQRAVAPQQVYVQPTQSVSHPTAFNPHFHQQVMAPPGLAQPVSVNYSMGPTEGSRPFTPVGATQPPQPTGPTQPTHTEPPPPANSNLPPSNPLEATHAVSDTMNEQLVSI